MMVSIVVLYFYSMARILITGGSGLVGKRLRQMLIDKNHDVIILSRYPKKKT